MSITFDLNQTDLFSQDSLFNLKNEQFSKDLPFYLCEVQENTIQFLFEGSRFCEYVLRDDQPVNPLTKRPITTFTMYEAVKEGSVFQAIFNQDTLKPINYLPVLWNDCSRSDIEKGEFYCRMGECYAFGTDCEIDQEKALEYYRIGSHLGYKTAQYNLMLLLDEKNLKDEHLYWSLKYLENLDPMVEDYFRCAKAFETAKHVKNYQEYAFYFFQKGAMAGNSYCIAKIIRYYEVGFGAARDESKAKAWREYLPEKWREAPIRDYMTFLCEDQSILTVIKKHPFPLDLEKMDVVEKPSPGFLFPEIKKVVS
jgi:hypothetical protein